jgi:hypothetical protein
MVDQHNMRGIGHLLPERTCPGAGGGGFKDRFRAVFANVTGINSRTQSTSGFEKLEQVKCVRFAQKYMIRFALKLDPIQLPQVEGKLFQANLPLDPGAFSAAVGYGARFPTKICTRLCNWFPHLLCLKRSGV